MFGARIFYHSFIVECCIHSLLRVYNCWKWDRMFVLWDYDSIIKVAGKEMTDRSKWHIYLRTSFSTICRLCLVISTNLVTFYSGSTDNYNLDYLTIMDIPCLFPKSLYSRLDGVTGRPSLWSEKWGKGKQCQSANSHLLGGLRHSLVTYRYKTAKKSGNWST